MNDIFVCFAKMFSSNMFSLFHGSGLINDFACLCEDYIINTQSTQKIQKSTIMYVYLYIRELVVTD